MRYLLFTLLLATASPALAQSLPIISQNPPGLRWQEVRTPHFRVLYPAGLDTAAQRTAQRLEAVHGPDGATLGVSAHPIAVVLQNQTTVSNGFVTFLPRHAEFFTTPQQGQGLGTVDWLDGLVVHEFRHVNQFDKAREGFGHVTHALLGDGGLGVAAVGVPQWFFEGDAVGTETALTRSGRGRIPYFGLGLRGNLLSGRLYSYQKAVNGSLRDNVPDWYVLGYFMTSYAKVHYGPDVWSRVLDRYYRFPFYPFSFSNSLRRTTGLRVEDLYQRTMRELDSTWRAEQAARPAPTPVRELAGQAGTRVFTQYQYPQYVNDSTIIALKTGLNNIPQLVLLSHHGREKRVFTLGSINIPEMLSVGGGKVVWPEFRQSPRWGQKVYSELKILHLGTGQARRSAARIVRFEWLHKLLKIGRVRRLATGTRYAAAALSPDGTRLVAVRTDASYHHALVVLDATTGKLLQTTPNPRNDFYQQPRWADNGDYVVAVALSAGGKTLQRIKVFTGLATGSAAATNLLPVANINLANPQPWGRYVLYNSPQTGVDNVFAVDTLSGKTYQVTNRPTGAYHAAVSPDGRHLAFQDYRATGARIVEMPLDPATWTALPAPARADAPTDPYAERLAAGEPAGRQITSLLASPDSAGPRYGVRRYRPLAHAFRVFSYGVVQSPAGNSVSVGLRSQDFLSTTQVFAGLTYNQTERTFAATGALSYQGLPMVLDVEGSYGGRDVSLLAGGTVYRDQWQVAHLLAGARLPLVLTRSKYLQALTLGAYYLNERVFDYDLPVRRRDEAGPNQGLHAIQTNLSYASQLRQSARDVAPRGGATLLATYRTTPFATKLQASQVGVQGSVYLPGLARHHALRLRGGYQYQQQAQYNFAAAISYPRAETDYLSFDNLAVGSVDYSLPLAFTHLALGRVLYVQRFRATAFADVARGNVLVQPINSPTPIRYYQDFRNFGTDFLVLFNVFHLRTPVEAGVRVAYSSYLQRVVVQPLAFSVRL